MADRFDYGPTHATAQRLLDRFGQDGALRRRVEGSVGSGDPWNPGSQTGGSTTDYPVRLVLGDYTARERSGSNVGATDKRAYISTEGLPDDLEPRADDELVVGGDAHAIVSLTAVNPGGTVLLYEAQVTW